MIKNSIFVLLVLLTFHFALSGQETHDISSDFFEDFSGSYDTTFVVDPIGIDLIVEDSEYSELNFEFAFGFDDGFLGFDLSNIDNIDSVLLDYSHLCIGQTDCFAIKVIQQSGEELIFDDLSTNTSGNSPFVYNDVEPISYIELSGFINIRFRELIVYVGGEATGFSHVSDSKIEVFPNPTKGLVYINHLSQEAGIEGFKVVNQNGKNLLNQRITGQSGTLDLNELGGPGIYFIRFYNVNGHVVDTKRLVSLGRL